MGLCLKHVYSESEKVCMERTVAALIRNTNNKENTVKTLK